MAIATTSQIQKAISQMMAQPNFKNTSYGKLTAAQILTQINAGSNSGLNNLVSGFIPSGVSLPTAAKPATPVAPKVDPITAAATKVGLSVPDYTAAVEKLIATNPTSKNRDVATISSMVGAQSGDPSVLIKTQDKAIKELAIADKAAQAQGFANAQAKKEAQNAADNAKVLAAKDAANKVAADKTATAKTVAETKAAVSQPVVKTAAEKAAEKAAADKAAADKVQAINTAQGNFTKILNSGAVTSEDITNYKSAVTAAGGTPQDLLINKATTAVSGKFQSQLATAKTPEEAAAIVKQAQDSGAPINQGYVDSTNQKFAQQVAQQAAAKQQELTNTLINKLYNNETGYPRQLTQSELDAVKKEAVDKNVILPAAYVQQAQQQVDRVAKDYAWSPPDTSKISTNVSQKSYATAPSGLKLVGLPDDPKTGQKAGWYVDTGAGFKAWDKGPGAEVIPYKEFDNTLQTVFGNVQQAQTDTKMSDWYKTVSSPEFKERSAFDFLFGNVRSTAPDGSEWVYQPADKTTGTGEAWFTKLPGEGNNWKQASITPSGVTMSDKVLSGNDLQNQLNQVANVNYQAQNAQIEAERAAYAAANPYKPNYATDDSFSFLDKLVLATFIAAVAAPYVSSLFAGEAGAGAAALTEGAEAAAGLASSGMSGAEVAATLEASGIPTVMADAMAESAVAAVTGTVDAGAALASSGVTAEALAAANAVVADPLAALVASQGWTTVDMAYLASIGAPASILAAAEATNIAAGLPASQVGTTAAAEVAGTVPPGTTAEVVASQPVAPTGAETAATAPVAPPVDTSQMIPTVDAAGNPGFYDPATGQVVNSSGEVVSQAVVPEVGPGTQVAEATQAVQPGVVSDTPFRVEVTGAAGTAEAPSYVKGALTEGSQLATTAEIDAGVAQWNAAANAWEVPAAVAEIPEIVITGTRLPPAITAGEVAGALGGAAAIGGALGGGGAAAPAPYNPNDLSLPARPVNTLPPAEPVPAQPAPQQPAEPVPAQPTPQQPTIPAEPGKAPVYDVTPTPVTPPPAPPPPEVVPQYPTDVPTTPVNPADPYAPDNIDVRGGFNPAEVPVVDAVATPVPPGTPGLPGSVGGGLSAADLAKIAAGWTIVNGLLTPPVQPNLSYGPIRPLDWGKGVPIDVAGLNPGYMTNVPAQYQTQNMQQSKFYWGQKPFQAGTTFDPNLYQSAAVPAQPFGLQQMYNPETQTIENLVAGVNQAATQAPYNLPAAPRV